jgi:hypothetical protein
LRATPVDTWRRAHDVIVILTSHSRTISARRACFPARCRFTFASLQSEGVYPALPVFSIHGSRGGRKSAFHGSAAPAQPYLRAPPYSRPSSCRQSERSMALQPSRSCVCVLRTANTDAQTQSWDGVAGSRVTDARHGGCHGRTTRRVSRTHAARKAQPHQPWLRREA